MPKISFPNSRINAQRKITGMYLQFIRRTDATQHISPPSAIKVHGIERAVLGRAGVGWNASFVVRVGHVDLVGRDGDAVRIVQARLENLWTGAVETRPHNTGCRAPVRVVQIPVFSVTHRTDITYWPSFNPEASTYHRHLPFYLLRNLIDPDADHYKNVGLVTTDEQRPTHSMPLTRGQDNKDIIKTNTVKDNYYYVKPQKVRCAEQCIG